MGKKRKKKKVLLSGSDPFYLSKKLRRRRYGEVSAQTSQKSQNRALVKKKVAYRAPAAQACTPPTWTINRIFSKSEILAESLVCMEKYKKKSWKISTIFFFFRIFFFEIFFFGHNIDFAGQNKLFFFGILFFFARARSKFEGGPGRVPKKKK